MEEDLQKLKDWISYLKIDLTVRITTAGDAFYFESPSLLGKGSKKETYELARAFLSGVTMALKIKKN